MIAQGGLRAHAGRTRTAVEGRECRAADGRRTEGDPPSPRSARTVSTDAHAEFLAEAKLGDRLADGIARVGGSWGFIIVFGLFLVSWALLNTIILASRAFDPYPFIFLNLLLSMIAAIQAPRHHDEPEPPIRPATASWPPRFTK